MDEINNTNITVMDEEEYLARKGVGSAFADTSLDTCRFPHGLTEHAHKRIMKQTEKKADEYYERRNKAREEYRALVENGTVRPRTNIERTILKANGNPDNASTQAARRVCEKRGIDWRVA